MKLTQTGDPRNVERSSVPPPNLSTMSAGACWPTARPMSGAEDGAGEPDAPGSRLALGAVVEPGDGGAGDSAGTRRAARDVPGGWHRGRSSTRHEVGQDREGDNDEDRRDQQADGDAGDGGAHRRGVYDAGPLVRVSRRAAAPPAHRGAGSPVLRSLSDVRHHARPPPHRTPRCPGPADGGRRDAARRRHPCLRPAGRQRRADPAVRRRDRHAAPHHGAVGRARHADPAAQPRPAAPASHRRSLRPRRPPRRPPRSPPARPPVSSCRP